MRKPIRGRHWRRSSTKRNWKQPDLLTKILRDGNQLDRDSKMGWAGFRQSMKTWGFFNRLGREPHQPITEWPF